MKSFLKLFLSKIIPRKLFLKIINSLLFFTKEDGKFVKHYGLINFNELKILSEEKEYLDLYRKALSIAGNTNSDNILKILRYYNLNSLIDETIRRAIDGAIAECGCWHGHSAFLIQEKFESKKIKKNFYIFDAFEDGFSEFKSQDLDNTFLKKKDIDDLNYEYISSFNLLKKKFSNKKNVFIKKGWIPDVFKNLKESKFCFVHIDVDLYEPTFDSFEFFFDRLSIGGYIVCDDYNYNLFPGARLAVDNFLNSIDSESYSIHRFSVGGCFIQKLK